MVTALRVAADLDFGIELPDGQTVQGRLHGHGQRLRLEVDRPEAFAGRADAGLLVGLADLLARRGLTIDVMRGDAIMLTIGAVRAPWWQRRFTGSQHIRLGGLRGLLAPGRARLRGGRQDGILPDLALAPPATMFPIAPTFRRRARVISTTHDPAHGGRPRLRLHSHERHGPVNAKTIYWLKNGVTSIGSGADCDIRLDGLRPLHAEVVHGHDDEFTVIAHDTAVRINGGPATGRLLRTSARLEVGSWTLIYSREEYADHGRPYGGRIGGELGHQRPQPPRTIIQELR